MITVFKATENKRQQYNEYVANSSYSSIYQSYEWGEIRRQDGWNVTRLIAMENDAVVGALSCLKREIPLIGKKIFYVPRGPVVDYHTEKGQQIFKYLLKELKQIAFQEGGVFIRISPDIPRGSSLEQFFTHYGFQAANLAILHTATFRLDLSKPEDELLHAMEGRTRYDIRKASRDGVTIVSDDRSEQYLQLFYQLLSEVAERNDFPIYSYNMMKTIWRMLRSNGFCKIFLSLYQNDFISGAFLLLFGKKCIYQWGGSTKKYPKVNPNQLMHWEIIRWAKSQGYTSYDFQGVPEDVKEDDPLWGIYLFKRGFGGELVKLIGEYDLVLSPFCYNLWRKFEPYYPQLKNKISALVRS